MELSTYLRLLLRYICFSLLISIGSCGSKDPQNQAATAPPETFSQSMWIKSIEGGELKDPSRINVLATIPYGTEVFANGEKHDDWVYVYAEGQEGWIDKRAIAPNYIYPVGHSFIDRQGRPFGEQVFQKIKEVDGYYQASFHSDFNEKASILSNTGQIYTSHAGTLVGIGDEVALFSNGSTHPYSTYIRLADDKQIYANYGGKPYSNEIAILEDRSTLKAINMAGHEAFEIGKGYAKAGSFSSGLLKLHYVKKNETNTEYIAQFIDKGGEWVLSSGIKGMKLDEQGCILDIYNGRQLRINGEGEVIRRMGLRYTRFPVANGYLDGSLMQAITLPDTAILHSPFSNFQALVLTPSTLQSIDDKGKAIFQVPHTFTDVTTSTPTDSTQWASNDLFAIGWLTNDHAYLMRTKRTGKNQPVALLIVNRAGEIVVNKTFDGAERMRPFSEGLAAFSARADQTQHFRQVMRKSPKSKVINTLWGYLDTLGNAVTAPNYLEVSDFHAGIAAVSPVHSYHPKNAQPLSFYQQLINHKDRIIIRDSIQRTGLSFSKEQSWYRHYQEPDTVRFTNSQGEDLGKIYLKREVLYQFENGNLLVNAPKEKQYDIIAPDSSWVGSIGFDFIGTFKEGLAVVVRNGKYGYIDTLGKLVIPLQFDYAGDFNEGMAIVGQGQFVNVCNYPTGAAHYEKNCHFLDGKFGYIDIQGHMLIGYQYTVAQPFYDGYAVVGNGKIEMQEVYTSNDSYLKPIFKGQYHYTDVHGFVAFPQKFPTQPRPFNNGLAWVNIDGKDCYIDQKGKVIYPKN